MIHAALILTLIIPSVSDRSRGGGTAFDGVFEFDADLDGIYKLYGDKTDDSNTYIYRSGADEWTVVSGGVDALICDASYCTFASGPKVGASIPFADAAGTLTLQNIDALDATTETTIEAAIDTLGDIAVGSVSQGDDKSVCQGADTDFCCEWDTDGTEGLLCTAADCDGLGGSCTAAHVYEDSGNLIADLKGIDSITNSSQKITVGPAGTSNHSTGANQCHFTCTQEEHEATYSYFDGELYVGNINMTNPVGSWILAATNYGLITLDLTTQTVKAPGLATGTTTNYWLLFPYDDRGTNYGITNPAEPTLIGQSNDETDITQRFSLSWNRLALGGDGGGLGCLNQTFAYDDFTDDGGASGHLDLDEQIPIGSDFPKMILHSITGFTGDTTAALTVGDSGGVDPDRYHSAGTLNVVASSAAGIACGEPSGTTKHSAAVTVRLVLTGAADFGNFSAGEATISICYWTP